MPELALIVFIGLLLCAISTVCVYLVEMRRFNSIESSQMQLNLTKIDKRWNSLKQIIEENNENNRQAQKSSMTFTIFVFGFGMSLLSWFGLFLFLITYFSIRLMGGSRKEKQLMQSSLVNESLSKDEVHLEISKNLMS